MWASADEPPGTMEAGPSTSQVQQDTATTINLTGKCDNSKSQLESVKDIMLRNKQCLKEKEEELQEYAKKLSKIKSRAKGSRRSKEQQEFKPLPSESQPKTDDTLSETADDGDISKANTPKAKSTLLQRKLAEDKKLFEKISKELIEEGKAVEEKVEEIKQQFGDKIAAPISAVNPVLVSSQMPHQLLEISGIENKDYEITKLNSKIIELESLIIDLRENLKEKDSVIDSKTKAVTLVSADLSKKGKNVLDTLEDTKDEMRSMQENFVALEMSLKNKNELLLQQLQERDNFILQLQENVQRTEDELKSCKLEHTTENSLMETLISKVDYLEERNKLLENEKLQLERNITICKDKIHSSESLIETSDAVNEKDNRIAELENIIEELRKSNQLLQEESRAELQKQIIDLNTKNEEILNKISDLEKEVFDLENEKREILGKQKLEEIQGHTEDHKKVQKLTKELDDLNKSMIKLKAQHKNKIKNLQRQLDNFKKVSDTNAELVRLANQVAVLEEEKGNLQLSLVDFDELKATIRDYQEKVAELESKVDMQAKEIQANSESIGILENQKLDLMQELHLVKQEISKLEAENAESENLRVTAEMKVVDMEEEFQKQIENLTQENEKLNHKLQKFDEKGSSEDVRSTESFVKTGSNVDSTESFDALSEADKTDLLKKIEVLTRENYNLTEKLNRFEEKGSSDSGSTESFEKIPEQSESFSKLELLTKENNKLVIKVTKLEEKLDRKTETDNILSDLEDRIQVLMQENNGLSSEIVHLNQKLELEVNNRVKRSESNNDEFKFTEAKKGAVQYAEEPSETAKKEGQSASSSEKIDILVKENSNYVKELAKLREENSKLMSKTIKDELVQTSVPSEDQQISNSTVADLQLEIEKYSKIITEQASAIEDLTIKLTEKESELEEKLTAIKNYQTTSSSIDALEKEIKDNESIINELKLKCENLELRAKSLEETKENIESNLHLLREEKHHLIEQLEQKNGIINSLKEELNVTINDFEIKLQEQTDIIIAKDEEIGKFRLLIDSKDQEIHEKYVQLQNEFIKVDSMQDNLFKLEAEVQQRDATITSLTEEIEALRTNASLFEEDLFMARNQLSNVNAKLQNCKSADEFSQLMEIANEKDIHINELENKVSQKATEINVLKRQLENSVFEIDELRDKLEAEEFKVKDLLETNIAQQDTLKTMENDKANIENKYLELKVSYDENLSNLQENRQNLELLKAKNLETTEVQNKKIQDLIEELNSKGEEIEKLCKVITEKDNTISNSISLEEKFALEAQIAELKINLLEAENKIQNQVEKMKKYVAVIQKKKSQNEDLESNLNLLEEKLSLEKNEKEENNRKLLQSLQQIEEHSNEIKNLETQILQLQEEKKEVNTKLDEYSIELQHAKDTINSLNDEIVSLNEAKDNARELGVRMQVMESEYIENLALINSLKAENGFLQSKQIQINEKLENVEKESEERRELIEKLEKEKEIMETQRLDTESAQEESRSLDNNYRENANHCENCIKLQSLINTLEAKLQERDAEIENLDNELHNSIDNLVQMQENLKLSTIPTDVSLHDTYSELNFQHNLLKVANEELKEKYKDLEKHNENLSRQIDELQNFSLSLQGGTEDLKKETLSSVSTMYSELQEQFNKQKLELDNAQHQLENYLKTHEHLDINVKSKIEQLELEKQKLIQEIEELRSITIKEDMFERTKRETEEVNESELERHNSVDEIKKLTDQVRDLSHQLEEEQIRSSEVESQLNLELERTRRKLELTTEELNNFGVQLEVQLNNNDSRLEAAIDFKDNQILSLQNEIAKDQESLSILRGEYDRLSNMLENKNLLVFELENEKLKYSNEIERFLLQNQEADRLIGNILNIAESTNKDLMSVQSAVTVDSRSLSDRLERIQVRFGEILSELEEMKIEKDNLLTSQELLKTEKESLELQKNALILERDQLLANLEISLKNQVPGAPLNQPLVSDNTDFGINLTVDDDPWGIDAAADKSFPAMPQAQPDLNLLTKVKELSEKVEYLEVENKKLLEEIEANKIRAAKYIKKLKEYKVQCELLKQQSFQKSNDFGDLNAAIEEELKLQIENLEKNLTELKADYQKLLADREKLLNRIDVLTAANERFTDVKEKQDVEIHVWQMRNKELENRILILEKQLGQGQETIASVDNTKDQQDVESLKQTIDILASENEELQQLLEEQRNKRKAQDEDSVLILQKENTELRVSENKLRHDYDILRNQYEQSLMDSSDQVNNLRHHNELLQLEFTEKVSGYEKEIDSLNSHLKVIVEENNQLMEKVNYIRIDQERFDNVQKTLQEANNEYFAKEQELLKLKEELKDLKEIKEGTDANNRETINQLLERNRNIEFELDSCVLNLKDKENMIAMLNSTIISLENDLQKLYEKIDELNLSLQRHELIAKDKDNEIDNKQVKINILENIIDEKEDLLTKKEALLSEHERQLKKSDSELEECSLKIKSQDMMQSKLQETENESKRLLLILEENATQIEYLNIRIKQLESELNDVTDNRNLLKLNLEKEIQKVHILESTLQIKQEIVDNYEIKLKSLDESAKVVDGLPGFTMGNSSELDILNAELKARDEEILTQSINNNSLSCIIQELQDKINLLYDEKSKLEEQLNEKNKELNSLKNDIENEEVTEAVSEFPTKGLVKRSLETETLQEKLNLREQEINEITHRYGEMEAKIEAELYAKQQEIENFKFTVSELQSEIASLRSLERLGEEDKNTISRLIAEKEKIIIEAEEDLQRMLSEKEEEIHAIKMKLTNEKEELIEMISLRDKDIENLIIKMEQTNTRHDEEILIKTEETSRIKDELMKNEQQLSELILVKDTEIYNLQVQIEEKNTKIESLTKLSEEEEKQLTELREIIQKKEQQIINLQRQLDEKNQEFVLLQHALQKHVEKVNLNFDVTGAQMQSQPPQDIESSSASELDIALYMLHQRDVRCEELTHELMQLLEERDTLQLRLSNAIRINEELRKHSTVNLNKSETNLSMIDYAPLAENPLPLVTEGPVEFAKEAINSSIGEDKAALAQKLSQLKSVSHVRDVRLKDEMELRHNQQMSLIKHQDILSKLPPEAAAQLVKANYTLSKDVQSQSSVLLSWLWGKSTPKVVHM